jgi:RNA polymerase sigma-70 factor, ECF subfamily
MKGGDWLEDFNVLFQLYHKQLLKYLFYLSKDYSLAEELLQETFYQAIKSVHRYNGSCKVSTWLYQIAKNTYSNHSRKHKNLQLDSENIIEDLSHNNTPEEIFKEREGKMEILNAIEQLKDPYRDVVILRALNQISFRKIGDILGQSENWAKVTYFRGKLQLKDILRKRGVSYED